VNGKLVDDATGPSTVSYGDFPLLIGADDNNDDGTPDGFFDGLIDEIRIYNRALSADEVKANMRGAVATDGLVLWLRFDEGSGDTVRDISGYGNNGTIYGATWTSGVTEENVPTAHVWLGIALAPSREVIRP